MSMTDCPTGTATEPKRRGRKLGGHNKPGHKAGRPKKPPEEFAPSVWEHGRCEIPVLQKHLDAAMRANSSHCAIAMAIADAIPGARHIAVDLQTIRWSLPKRGVRYVFLTPHVAQQDVIIPFDQGEECHPVTFKMRPAWITRIGAKRNHTPEPEQLKGTGLKVADEQPDRASPEAVREFVGALTGDPPPDRKLIPYAGKPHQPRQRRARISATKPDGTIPVTLGGKLPPVSVLARREFGIRVLKRNPAGQHGQSKQEIGDRASGETPGTANEGPPCWREAEGEAPGRANQS
jgi:hypothetical protein